ncbi:hypothetical protein JNUCC0626_08935 [Lentzea sp. JNUCC 0626]|uniref:hypothetical protein n=1 Tax=Lentzea sp. JNUCC 0626 TaxID=3367513 RepID=UPI003749C5CC
MSGSLYDHAVALHRRFPDGPLPRDGAPYPDEERQRARPPRPRHSPRRVGADTAAVLDNYFSSPQRRIEWLAETLSEVGAPNRLNGHVTAAALRANRWQVRRAGRWLVRYGEDRAVVAAGLGLLASDNHDGDIPLLRTIGLLSDAFAPLVSDALLRRKSGTVALTWLADHTAGWGRVYVVEALCHRRTPARGADLRRSR